MTASSSSATRSWTYDVFMSFRGDDTRYNFTDHLYNYFVQKGIKTFIDDELEKGEEISQALRRAIQESRISLIVFSENYASSKWCLDELVHILECNRSNQQRKIFPVFYKVDPSDVGHQSGSFGDALANHERRFKDNMDKVKGWRKALTEAANLSGCHFSDGYEAEVIEEIVDNISRRLNNTYLHVAVYPVGIDSRIEDISNSLGVGQDDDVRMVGIWGMGGSGKTSLAKAIYNKFYHDFEGKSFLANVREAANQSNGMINLQERLLSDILKPTKVEVGDAHRGIKAIQERLGSKKVLVIVDDVDDVYQLTALAIERDSFGPGSRIIITTRDRHLLEILQVDTIHPAREMKDEEALELFSRHAFHNPHPDAKFLDVSKRACSCCRGLPLALEVLGSLLFGRSVYDCGETLDKLEEYPNYRIQKILRISFDALDGNQKDIFLHISCFFIGMDKNYVTKILKGCGLFAGTDITVLLERCLVIVSEKNKLMMHDLLRDMGREVVRAESPKDPEERSRLWCQKEVIEVLTEESGTKKIEGLSLNLQRSNKKSFGTKAFKKMQKLKLLQLNYVKLTGDYGHLSKKLSWLCWHGFSQEFIGNDFLYQGSLVSMDLQYSNLVQVWKNPRLLEKLKILNLSHSHCLTQSPDLSKLPNLEYFIMKDCRSLPEIHPSIGDVKRLALVNLKDCKMLKDLPRSFYKLKFMETLVLSGCSRFENLVEDIGDMTSLTTLVVRDTAISQVPSYMGRLKNLTYSSVQGLVRLKQRFPEVPKKYFPAQDYTSLTHLNIESSSVHNLPELSCLSHLERPCFKKLQKTGENLNMWNQFSSGLESANLLVTSDLVHHAWGAIEEQKEINPNAELSLYNEIQKSNFTIIAFGTPRGSLQGKEGLISSSILKEEDFPHFEFLCNKSNSWFSINEAAISIFRSNYDELNLLKDKMSNCTSSIIITGRSVGGCVAILFTLWLLHSFNVSKTRRSLCITFGSPLLGDERLRRCVSEFSTWKSCFLHVASNQDRIPKLFLSQNPNGTYKPFGTFLLCSASGCACFKEPDSILEWLVIANFQSSQNPDADLGQQYFDYGKILKDLKLRALCIDDFKFAEGEIDPLKVGIITQLQAIGVPLTQKEPHTETNSVIKRIERHEKLLTQRKNVSNSFKKLRDMQIYMASLEWYKKDAKHKKIGYYDMYKELRNTSGMDVYGYKKKLMSYWQDSVAEEEYKPHEEGDFFWTSWLMAGTSYRRMIEPLHIAEYYMEDVADNYITDKRPRHFILLEQWWNEREKPEASPNKAWIKRQVAASRLNEDSCFWAHVEEALISCNLLNNKKSLIHDKESSKQKLKEFEGYVYDAIKNNAVSLDIFLERSSFRQWWNKYKEIMGSSYCSSLMMKFWKVMEEC